MIEEMTQDRLAAHGLRAVTLYGFYHSHGSILLPANDQQDKQPFTCNIKTQCRAKSFIATINSPQ